MHLPHAEIDLYEIRTRAINDALVSDVSEKDEAQLTGLLPLVATDHIAKKLITVESVLSLREDGDQIDVANGISDEDELHEEVDPGEIVARTATERAALTTELLALHG